jgi:hypothetical protein
MAAALVQVKGSALRSRLTWVKEQCGLRGLRELEGELSAAGRQLLHGDLDPRAWYNLPLFLEICTACDRRFGAGDGLLNVEMARYGAHANTPVFYQAFVKLGSIDWVLGRASKLWHEHFSAGQLVVRHDAGSQRAEAEILDFPAPHVCLAYSTLGFAIGCIELSGGREVKGEVVSARARGAERDLLRVAWS